MFLLNVITDNIKIYMYNYTFKHMKGSFITSAFITDLHIYALCIHLDTCYNKPHILCCRYDVNCILANYFAYSVFTPHVYNLHIIYMWCGILCGSINGFQCESIWQIQEFLKTTPKMFGLCLWLRTTCLHIIEKSNI